MEWHANRQTSNDNNLNDLLWSNFSAEDETLKCVSADCRTLMLIKVRRDSPSGLYMPYEDMQMTENLLKHKEKETLYVLI